MLVWIPVFELSPITVPNLTLPVETSTPLTIDETFDLSIYDLDAQILYIPGHTKGSIGVLTVDGNLFCGDLYMNMIKPDIQFFIDDLTAAKESLNKLKSLTIKTVYPGHGKPFQYGKVSNLQI